jgi:hypothetical protein
MWMHLASAGAAFNARHVTDHGAELSLRERPPDRHLSRQLEQLGTAGAKVKQIPALPSGVLDARQRVAGAAGLVEQDAPGRLPVGAAAAGQ